jgi:hypothetical protein
MIAMVAVRPNIDDNLFSREWNYAHLNYGKENRCWADPNYFQSEFPFFRTILTMCQNYPSNFFSVGSSEMTGCGVG